jgi:8-oxo-dGTP pyrophosphatase MutT (NUDIX family)
MESSDHSTLLFRGTNTGFTMEPLEVWESDAPRSDVGVSGAVCLLFDEDDALVMVEVRSRGWDVPGGHSEDAETPLETVVRESAEEIGVAPDEYHTPVFTGYLLVGAARPRQILVFSSRLLTQRPLVSSMPQEIAEVHHLPLSALPDVATTRGWYPFIAPPA